MVTKACSALLLTLALFVATSCGSSDVKADKFSKALADKTELTSAQAKCVSDQVYKTFDQSEINKLYEANDVEKVGKANADKFTAIVKGCVKS